MRSCGVGADIARPGARDAVAWTTSADPTKIVLEFFKAPDGKWLPPTVPGVRGHSKTNVVHGKASTACNGKNSK